MAKLKLTEQQQAAVENRGGSLLVSAAAGSGKTRVLVHKLASLLLLEDAGGAAVPICDGRPLPYR